MSLYLDQEHWQLMIEEAIRCAPAESCGLITGKDSRAMWVFPLPNITENPDRFYIDPQRQLQVFDWLEANGQELVAIFHSHPRGPETPSPTDIDQFYYPGVISVILFPKDGNWSGRGYLIHEGIYEEVALLLKDSEQR